MISLQRAFPVTHPLSQEQALQKTLRLGINSLIKNSSNNQMGTDRTSEISRGAVGLGKNIPSRCRTAYSMVRFQFYCVSNWPLTMREVTTVLTKNRRHNPEKRGGYYMGSNIFLARNTRGAARYSAFLLLLDYYF